MRFGHPDYLFLFLLLPVLVGLMLWQTYQQRRSWRRLADTGLQEKIMPAYSPFRKGVKNFLKILVFVFLVLSLMEPQWGMKEEEVKLRGVNIILLADVSSSMLAQDIKPSRLQREKRKVRDLLQMLSGDRIGLIAFAGRSFLLSPLTADYGTLERYIEELGPETIPVQGTDVAGAIQLALRALPEGDEAGKAILLFTDGEDHGEQMAKIQKELQERKVRVFILGIGTPEGAPVPDPAGGFKSNLEGGTVVSKLEEGFLQKLALETGGAYVRTVTGDEDLKELYLKGIRGVLSPTDLRVTKKKIWESRFYWPLSIALFFLLVERLIPEGRRQRKFLQTNKHILSGLMLLIILIPKGVYAGSTWSLWQDYSARRAYQKGEYAEAEKKFERVLQSDPEPEDFLNIGAAQYRQQNYPEARQSFSAALNANDASIKGKAYYNLGNTLYRMQRPQEALEAYANALKIQPQDQEARLNFEFVKKQLENRPPPSPSPQPQPQEGDRQGEQKGQGQEGEKKETPDQEKQKQSGDKGQGREEESQDQGQADQGGGRDQAGKSEQEKSEGKASEQEQKQEQKKDAGEGKAEDSHQGEGAEAPKAPQQPQAEQPPPSDGTEKQGQEGGSATRGETQEPKNLEGKLEASGQAPPQPGKEREGMAPATDFDPKIKEAERWLEMVEDKSEEIQRAQIERAMGRSRSPEKDW